VLKQRQQQAAGDGQADALGLGRGGEAGQAVGIEDDGAVELSVEVVALGTEVIVVLREGVELLAVVGAIDGLNHAGCVAVEGLTGGAAEDSLSGDSPVGAVEDSGGVGDAQGRR
jgi:hypothetical protein